MLVKHDWSLMLKDPYFSHIDSKWMLNCLARQKKAQPLVARLASREGHVFSNRATLWRAVREHAFMTKHTPHNCWCDSIANDCNLAHLAGNTQHPKLDNTVDEAPRTEMRATESIGKNAKPEPAHAVQRTSAQADRRHHSRGFKSAALALQRKTRSERFLPTHCAESCMLAL